MGIIKVKVIMFILRIWFYILFVGMVIFVLVGLLFIVRVSVIKSLLVIINGIMCEMLFIKKWYKFEWVCEVLFVIDWVLIVLVW